MFCFQYDLDAFVDILTLSSYLNPNTTYHNQSLTGRQSSHDVDVVYHLAVLSAYAMRFLGYSLILSMSDLFLIDTVRGGSDFDIICVEQVSYTLSLMGV